MPGIHTNMPGVLPDEIDKAAFSGAPAPSGLSADEKLAYERLQFVYQKGIAYGYRALRKQLESSLEAVTASQYLYRNNDNLNNRVVPPVPTVARPIS